MTPEMVARRFGVRPGYDLVSYGEVGLPFYRIAITAHVLEHKEIGPFAEYSLRAIDAGLGEPDEIGKLLGLDAPVVDATLGELLHNDELMFARSPDKDQPTLMLTSKGRTTLSTATAIVPEQAVIEIDFDGLLRRPVPYIDRWLAPIELEKHGIREIPPSPTRPPELKDIDITAVEKLIRILGDRREAKRDLLTFKALERRRRFRPAVALIYQGEDPLDVQVAFAIDGVLSPEHEEAFARSRFKRTLIGGGGIEPAQTLIEGLLGEAVMQQLNIERWHQLRDQVAAASLRIEVPPSMDEEDRTVPPPDRIVADAKQELAAMVVRPLETYDHPDLLKDALARSQDRLLIISPWIRGAVVDESFITTLEARLTEGVDVLIGWGMKASEQRDHDIDPTVLTQFHRLGERFKRTFYFKRLGNTHAKVLISDRRFMIVTSFNWLSFRGDPKRTFRDERGMYITLRDQIDAQFDSWASRIRSSG